MPKFAFKKWCPLDFKIHSANYNDSTLVSGSVSSVTRHNSLYTYIIDRGFGRKLQKSPKHVFKKWCPLDFKIHSANYSESTLVSGTVSSVARHNSHNIGRRFGRKLQKMLKHRTQCPVQIFVGSLCFCFVNERTAVFPGINPLTPNDPYRGCTASLTSKIAFYIFNKYIYWIF